ncbi:MAG: heparinase II/III family protein, partial [Candidatus Sulfotelmatobacter sp.]
MRPSWARRWAWIGTDCPRLRLDFPDLPPVHLPEWKGAEVGALADGVIQHFNEGYALGRQRPDWRLGRVSVGRLWTVTLHCHSWVYRLASTAVAGDSEAELASTLLQNYVSDWMDHCSLTSPGARELAWNAYAVATRLAWWIRSYELLGRMLRARRADFEAAFLRSTWQQAAYLHDHIEWDVRANHLMRNAVGLAYAGRFFGEPQAGRWLRTATALVADQAREQVLPDGGHYERSPMYHIHIMEDLLVLGALVDDPGVRSQICETWRHMAEYLAWLRHPDSAIPLFNDAALNGACAPEGMLQLADKLTVAVNLSRRVAGRHFADT